MSDFGSFTKLYFLLDWFITHICLQSKHYAQSCNFPFTHPSEPTHTHSIPIIKSVFIYSSHSPPCSVSTFCSLTPCPYHIPSDSVLFLRLYFPALYAPTYCDCRSSRRLSKSGPTAPCFLTKIRRPGRLSSSAERVWGPLYFISQRLLFLISLFVGKSIN